MQAGASKQVDFTLETKLTEEITVTATKREQTLLDVPFSVAALHRGDAARARRRGHRGRRRERRRLHRAEPRPRPEPGRHARRLGRPDRARPAGREGAGRRLPRRVGDLAVALHARPRSVRHEPRRGAARSAGHAVRLRLAVGHRALHHQPARARRSTKGVRRARRRAPSTAGASAATSSSAFNVPLGDKAALRVAAYYDRLAGFIDAVQPDLQREGGRQRRLPHRRARRGRGSRRATSLSITPRIVYQRVEDGRLEPHRRRSTSSPIRSRRRGRR